MITLFRVPDGETLAGFDLSARPMMSTVVPERCALVLVTSENTIAVQEWLLVPHCHTALGVPAGAHGGGHLELRIEPQRECVYHCRFLTSRGGEALVVTRDVPSGITTAPTEPGFLPPDIAELRRWALLVRQDHSALPHLLAFIDTLVDRSPRTSIEDSGGDYDDDPDED